MDFNESITEEAALEWFEVLGYAVGLGSQMARKRNDSLPVQLDVEQVVSLLSLPY